MKIYNVGDVVKMLPLLKSYCNSLTEYSKWVADVFTRRMSQEELDDTMLRNWERLEELENEFGVNDPECKICDCRRGRIDVAIVHPHINEVMFVCVSSNTMNEADLLAHRGTKSKERKGIWEYEVDDV